MIENESNNRNRAFRIGFLGGFLAKREIYKTRNKAPPDHSKICTYAFPPPSRNQELFYGLSVSRFALICGGGTATRLRRQDRPARWWKAREQARNQPREPNCRSNLRYRCPEEEPAKHLHGR
jgi:hypothetical protein